MNTCLPLMSWGLVDGRMLVHTAHGIQVTRTEGPAPQPWSAGRSSSRYSMRFAELDGDRFWIVVLFCVLD